MRFSSLTQKKQWSIYPASPDCTNLAGKLSVSPLIAQVLINRGVTTVEECKSFLHPKLTDLVEPEKMPGVGAAVERIAKAVKDSEKITIYGDYDVDGITATAILFQLLKMLDADVDYYIPHRLEEGYGLNADAIEQIARKGTNVLITVDCGITAFDSAKLAAELGIDLVITDHHQFAGDQLPQAVAIVHAGLDKSYPWQNPSGAMVAFKLAWAVANKFKVDGKTDPKLREFLINATIFAAMGTIADVVNICGENRIIASFGLKAISDTQLSGLKALIEMVRLSNETIDSYHVGFFIAPLLNAAGRMGHARLAVELLTTTSQLNSIKIAQYLKQQNNQRKQCERKIFAQASELVTTKGMDHPDRRSIVIGSNDWHTGVIGIVASRMVDKYYRPAIMINISKDKAQGSARSIPGFDILAAITACSEHLNTFGGHAMAAGLTLDVEKLDKFAEDLEKYAIQNLKDSEMVSKLDIDALCSIKDLSIPAVQQLHNLGPFGKGNPPPTLITKGVRLVAAPRRVGANGEHLQITVCDNSASLRCIGFKMARFEKKLLENEFFNIAYEPKIDNYMGSTTVQLVLTDIQFE